MAVIPWLCVAGGVVGLARGTWHMWEGEGSTSWPKVKGVVHSSRVEQHGGGKGPAWFEAVIEYAYEVGNHTYSCDRWSYGRDNWFGNPEEAEALAARFREAQVVDVHHHPTIPGRAVLVPGMGNAGLVTAVLGGILLFGGLYYLLTQ